MNDWQAQAIALGWHEMIVESVAGHVRRQNGHVLLVTANVIAFRTRLGALQREIRTWGRDCLRLANEETECLPQYVSPES